MTADQFDHFIGQTVTWSSPQLDIEATGTVTSTRVIRRRVPSRKTGMVVWQDTDLAELFVEWEQPGPRDCWFVPGDSIIRLDVDDEWYVKVQSDRHGLCSVIVWAPNAARAADKARAFVNDPGTMTLVETTRTSDLF